VRADYSQAENMILVFKGDGSTIISLIVRNYQLRIVAVPDFRRQ
jgi:hypothetical protein